MNWSCRIPVVGALAAVLLAEASIDLHAQEFVPLVTFTNGWRYNDTGMDLGTNWRTRAFDDKEWPVGVPMFGVEPGVPFPYAGAGFEGITTPLLLMPPGSNSQTITYYFRTRFDLPVASNLVDSLLVTGYVDDGCVFYINGVEAGRARVSPSQDWQRLANASATEGAADFWTVNAALLVATNNVLAVEVHQVSVPGSDVVCALKLDATVAQPLAIVAQPQSQTNMAGTYATFTVGVTGGPVVYRWRKNGVIIPGTTNASLTLGSASAPLQLSSAGTYSVVVSNGFGAVVSDDALLTVLPDNQGPRMLDAVVLEETIRTNRIRITWNERLTSSTVTPQSGVTNFQVIMFPSMIRVGISNVQYNPGTFPSPDIPPSVTLTMNTTNWHIGSNYFISVVRVRDSSGNVVAPDSRIPVSWPRNTNVIPPGHIWSFHSSAFFEPDIFEQPWNATNFVEGSWWVSAPGPFCSGFIQSTCLGPFCNTDIGFQPQPSLFRTTFVVPMNPGSPSQLRFSYIVDDGAAFYLNGTELFRSNLPGGLLTSESKAIGNGVQAFCISNIILDATNLLPGTNWLAAAVFDSSSTDGQTAFHTELTHSGYFPGEVPEVPVPRLNIAAEGTNRLRLWWDGPGYALESTTNLVFTNGGAIGPWMEVTNMSNPFIDVLNGERRLFRLRQ